MVEYLVEDLPSVGELVSLYTSVGWTNYTASPESLGRAVENSTFVVVARSEDELVGLARCISDDVSIFYLQDVLVKPEHQRQGVARKLLEHCLDRFDHVRQHVLLTDNQEHQHRLYRSAGYHDVASLKDVPLHAFVNIKDVELS